MEHRVFVAHRKDEADPRRLVEVLTARFAAEFPGEPVVVVSGNQHFEEHAGNLGGWKNWIYEVHSGVDGDERPHFDICVVPDREIGKATAEMIEGFLGMGKSVVYWQRDTDMFAKVSGIQRLPGDSWKNWAVVDLDQG